MLSSLSGKGRYTLDTNRYDEEIVFLLLEVSKNGIVHFVDYCTCALIGKEQKLARTISVCSEIVRPVTILRHYLERSRFVTRADSEKHRWFFTMTYATAKYHASDEGLLEFNFNVTHSARKKQKVAEGLSVTNANGKQETFLHAEIPVLSIT